MDTGFWQKGFSADVAAAVPGYVLGGVASFSVPWTIGTIGGLAAIALEQTSAWPIYPRVSVVHHRRSNYPSDIAYLGHDRRRD